MTTMFGYMLTLLLLALTYGHSYTITPLKKGGNMGNLYSSIEDVESSGNPLAESLKGAVGLMQITKPALDDYNNAHNENVTMDDMTDASPNRKVGRWYASKRIPQMLQSYKIPVILDNLLWAYNAGISRVQQGVMPDETKDYISKIKAKLSGKEQTLPVEGSTANAIKRGPYSPAYGQMRGERG